MVEPSDPFRPATGPGTPVSRKKFVKTAVLAGAVGAAAATGAIAIGSTLAPVARAPKFDYWGVRVLPGSQAPRGIPIIPVRITSEGQLQGIPDRLRWYRYCGREKAPNLQDGFATDNLFRYHIEPSVLATAKNEGIDVWYESLVGQPAQPEHFDEMGKGATVLWRSEGLEREYPLTSLLIRVDPLGFNAGMAAEFLPDGVLAVFSACAHLCLIPTYRTSRKGYGAGHWDDIVCFGHGSWYSPRELARYPFPPEG